MEKSQEEKGSDDKTDVGTRGKLGGRVDKKRGRGTSRLEYIPHIINVMNV